MFQPKVFTIHKTQSDAQNNLDPIKLNPGEKGFRVSLNKKRSPMRLDPTFTDAVTTTGKWYLQLQTISLVNLIKMSSTSRSHTPFGSSDYKARILLLIHGMSVSTILVRRMTEPTNYVMSFLSTLRTQEILSMDLSSRQELTTHRKLYLRRLY